MGKLALLLLLFSTSTIFHLCNGCTMEGVFLWAIPVAETILDTYRGTVLNRSTSNIEEIISIDHGNRLNGGPYIETSLSDSRFLMRTNDLYADYEEYETLDSMSITITFRCTGGGTTPLVVVISVEDTNNNAPVFIPSNELEFIIATPVPPGFLVTGCAGGVTVRDIDLTTQRIDFGIDDNPYFEIVYDQSLSTRPKEFMAAIRTTTFIRTVQEPITLRISATDVDRTNDPAITTYATLVIKSDTEFEFPEEPVFTQPFYLANYTRDNELVHEPISLRQGFDDFVEFYLDGDHVNNFELVNNGNQLHIRVTSPLSSDILLENQMFLVVRAERNYTSGGSATIIIQLPEVIPLEFERAHYSGAIKDNNLEVSQLTLTQGYENLINVSIMSDHASYFNASVQGNAITIAMSPLSENVILENNFIYLQVVASTDHSVASAIVTLEIVKDDHFTPVFEGALYTGTYNSSTGLDIEQIAIVSGFDETVTLNLEGDYVEFFQVVQNGSNISLVSSTLPPEIYSKHHILLTLEATKPRTVGATAAIVIYLPEARKLNFEELTYRGTLRDNVLILETIVLRDGYDDNVNFSISGDHANHFTVSNIQNRVNLNLVTPIPENVIGENSFIILNLGADGLNAITTRVTILLEIIKADINTPLFSHNVYYATYRGTNDIDIENIILTQGYDSSVTFRIEGDHSQYFGISNTGNNVFVSLASAIPSDVIFREKVLYINILADKELTVGANAVVLIRFPAELTEPVQMRFAQNTYTGLIVNNELFVETIILDVGYETGTNFSLTGDYVQYFQVSNTNNAVTISFINTIPATITAVNNLLILDIEARRERAVSVSASVVIEVVRPIIEIPVFSEAYYRGVYAENTGLLFEDQIYLSSGYDETVTFSLEGEFASLFSLGQTNDLVTLSVPTSIPTEILENNDRLLFAIIANKPNSTNGSAAILIDIQKETIPELVLLSFERVTYVGTIENNTVTVDPIVLSQGFNSNVSFSLHGDLASYFRLTSVGQSVNIVLQTAIPEPLIPANGVIVLEVQASAQGAVTAHTTVVLTVVTESDLTPIVELVFSEAHYTGSFTELGGLVFATPISLSQGYDDTVQFALEGDDSQWFGLTRSQNSVTLTLTSAIPAAVIANNRHLIFSVTAQRPGSATTRTTIVIALTDEYTEEMSLLGFERVTYVGTIENNTVTVDSIVLSQGFTSNVSFSLHGDLASYFRLTSVGHSVNIVLQTAIPEASIPANGVIVLEVQASAQDAVTAHTTVVLTVVTESDLTPIVELVFSEAHYTGSFTELGGLVIATPISLSQGYDDTVQFALEGDDSQWFGLTRSQNSVTLTLTSAIPAAVIANNRHLIFSVTAQRPGSATARTTIVIALTDEYTEEMSLLGFERVTYVGTIENNTVTVDSIVLSQGFTSNVSFSLHGDLASYFRLTSAGQSVNIVLQTAIPEPSIPANGVIVLEVQASAQGAVTAHTTVVLTVVTESDLTPIVELVFSEAHYTGSFTELGGLVFATPISLSQGYDDAVQFALEGDDSQWFGLTRSQNSVTLTLTSAIPAAVIANNRHLIFSVTAQRPGSATARTTIVIALTDEYTEEMSLLGFERVTYVGTIENNTVTVDSIVLSQGFTSNVSFSLHGDLASYFRLTSVGQSVNIVLQTAIPEPSIPANGVIVLEVQASAQGAVTAHTTVVLTVVTESDLTPIVELVFSEAHYTGSFTELGGLVFATPISLSQGYDDTVQFALEGDDSQWFGLTRSQNSVTLTLTSAIPAAVIANNRHLIFSVTAQRPGSATARTTIVIALTDEYTEEMSLLGFERVTYVGTIENNTVTVDSIVLSQGFTSNVSFSLHGDLASYFRLTSVGQSVNIVLQTAIPEASIPANGVIVLEVQASAQGAVTAHTTVVLTVVTESDLTPIVELVFSEAHYTGSFTELGGLVFATPISLSQGYDDAVQFALEGDDSQWFGLTRSQMSVTLTLTSAIPAAVIANNRHLIFSVTAQRPGSATARTTIVIALTDEYTEEMSLLGFERVTYVGTIENNTVTVDSIVLSQGFTSNVSFSLHGDLASYFRLTSVGQSVNIVLQTAIPEASIPANGVIVLEVQASAQDAVTAHTTVVLTVVTESDLTPIVELVFSEAHYTGSFTELGGLEIATPISLSQGYDDMVQFALEGDDSQWFGLTRSQMSVTLTLTSAIPAAVIANNRHLIFSVTAQRPGSATARTTIVIALTDEYTEEMSLLGFERVTYVGTIENNTVTVDSIVLSQGFTSNVSFSLHGDLASYFRLTSVGQSVNIVLQTAIPEASIPANGVIVLEVQASAQDAVTAHTTVVLTVVTESDLTPIVELVFSEAHYTGSFTELGGLVIATPISLSQGYDDMVQFALEGDDSQWFGLTRSQNSVTLTLTSAIPAAVIANNRHLIFSVTAQRPGSATARTTIVIALTDEYTEEMSLLGFERVTYVGTIENNTVTVDSIVLSQGFTSNVSFSLHGDLASYFRLTSVGQSVNIVLQTAIPEASIPANGVIVLEVQASAQDAVTAHTTVVLTVVTESDLTPIVELVFSEAHYTGSFTELGGLVIATPISLSQGYDDMVQFALEGDDSQWFGLTRSQNSVTLTLTSAIPAAVIANNRHLIFSVTAQRPGSATARTTIVIALTDEYTEEMSLLGFERVTYVGTIENNTVTVDSIVLSQGFTSNVSFSLHGDLASYFRLTSVGQSVNIVLQTAIPEASIPANGVIVLEVQASAQGAVTAHTTVVLTVVKESDLTPIVELVFSEAHYTGSFTELGGLVFATPISLSQGYDDTVQFALEGDDSQWFGLTRSQNSVTLTLTSAIPAAVIANNRHLIFSVTAQRPGSATARTTIVIALTDEYTEEMSLLGFERVTYVGTIENNTVTVDSIVLSQGFTSNVSFSLHGDLASYFRLTSVGQSVNIVLQTAIPEPSIPANGVIVLEVQASAQGAVTAHTTVVLTVVTESDLTPIVELVFSEAHYTGSFTELGGLVIATPISLSQGYDDTVQFALEGDDSQWFGLTRSQNSVTLTLTSAIPAAVIANNRHLIFSVTAQRPGSATARTTIVIALTDEYTEEMSLLGFERVTYVGTIENNTVTVDSIVLSQGFTSNVSFSLHGDLASYFRLTSVGQSVNIVLQTAIPEASIPANGVIVLEVQASAQGAVTAHTTVVLTVVTESDLTPIVELVFSEAHYTGSFTELGGLVIATPISLSQGYDDTVQFALEGDDSQWFGLTRSQNSVTLTLTSAIPAAVIANNRHLIFSVTAQRPGSATARTTIVIALTDEYTEEMSLLGFERVTYVGTIENNTVTVDSIVLSQGFTSNVSFSLHGDLASYFRLTSVGQSVNIVLQTAIPEASIPANGVIVLEVQASAQDAVTAHTTVVLTVVTESDLTPIVELVFSEAHYTGSFTELGGLVIATPISLSQGYDDTVQFALEGDDSQWFGLTRSQNSVTLTLTSAIPAAVIANNRHLIFSVTAQRPGSATARTTIVIALTDEYTEEMSLLGFERVTYVGTIENNTVTVDSIVLSQGFTSNVSFSLHGDLASYFRLTSVGQSVNIVLQTAIPEASIPANGVIVLEVQASAQGAVTAHTTVVLTVVKESDLTPIVELVFSEAHYTGSFTELGGLVFATPISLSQGYDDTVQFALEGDDSQWFGLTRSQNSVTLTLTSAIPAAVIANNRHLIFSVTAQRPGSATARTTIVIALTDEYTEEMSLLGFERVTYVGTIENNTVTVDSIVLSQGFTSNVSFSLHGDLASYFRLTSVGQSVNIVLQTAIPEASIPANGVIVLEVQASAQDAVTAHTTVVLTVVTESDLTPIVELVFSEAHYTGSFTELGGLVFATPISLSQGYDDTVQFALEGDDSQWFGLTRSQMSVTLTLTSAIPAAVIANNRYLIFSITAQRPGSAIARATVIISLSGDTDIELDVRFDRVLYHGLLQNSVVLHERINVVGFNGTNIEIHGEFSGSFTARVSGEEVFVQTSGSVTSLNITHITLELHASTARAVLVLAVESSVEETPLPVVTFTSPSYSLSLDNTQTGLVGRVIATADNGETIRYSITSNEHLMDRISINDSGEIHLSAPAQSGVYIAVVIATTVFSQARAQATIHITVTAVTVCGEDDLVVPPLIIIDRDEEMAHKNLVVLNETEHPGCRFTLNNRWPANQTWLYVDEAGLHTEAIDREHESIALMALSQVQVELTLHCDDANVRKKRSLDARPEWLGPYDYGTSDWILTDTILYNPRRSLVNLIVNDINDNRPIFIGKENEPIAVGYPVDDLVETIMPRSLVELQATDADIGINAALVYWSTEEAISVSPTSGFVHVRDGASVENNTRLIIHATDRRGEGLSGSIEILVQLLYTENIAVITVRNAFLDEEKSILAELSSALGYAVKVLRSTVIADGTQANQDDSSRKQRSTQATGSSLQLYVYGMIERVPVTVDRLTTDVNNNAIVAGTVANVVSLQDYLEGREICVIPGRNTGLLVATILLSILLFILMVLIIVWFILKRRNKLKNYEEFSDQNSLASRNESLGSQPKLMIASKPRPNIDEIKRSERRLQDMLQAPVPEQEIRPTTSRKEFQPESIIDISPVEAPAPVVTVIQSIDKLKDATDESDNDEFGERTTARRKSVVTFNENVEKIIHVEDNDNLTPQPGYEIYKL